MIRKNGSDVMMLMMIMVITIIVIFILATIIIVKNNNYNDIEYNDNRYRILVKGKVTKSDGNDI